MVGKTFKSILIFLLIGTLLTACSGNQSGSGDQTGSIDPGITVEEMVTKLMEVNEQPMLAEMESDLVESLYHLNPELLEEYAIRYPLINIKTNEVAVLKVKDSKDIATVEEAVRQRAEDVQKTFENYLPDQYENAMNYKLVTKGQYIMFAICEDSDKLETTFNDFFTDK